jgi:large repetitive protein
LPAGLINAEGSVNGGAWLSWSSPRSLGAIAAGSSIPVQIRATVDCGTVSGTVLNNTATVSTTSTESNYGNNSASASATVQGLDPGPVISAQPLLCCEHQAGLVFSTNAVTGATGYIWTVPPGCVITSGQGTTSITVTAGQTSGDICVQVTNGACTSTATSCLTLNIQNPPHKPVFKN